VRRLIINADDFGLTRGVNRAIVEGYELGIVSSATLMANGEAFDEAVSMSKARPGLGVGCHVTLVGGAPQLDASQVRTLLRNQARDNGCARFPESLSAFAFRAITKRLSPAQIEAEATAQIRRLQSSGIVVSHLDTHKHTHMFAQILQPLLKAAKACGVHAIRNPFEPVELAHLVERPKLWKRGIEVFALGALAGKFRRAAEAAGVATPEGSLGIVATGHWDERAFRSMLENMPEGTWELVCHPGYVDAELRGAKTRLLASRAEELRILTSVEARDLLDQYGIQLISYRDLGGRGG
jgi:hopanoid biosynthesis associated protein HpnK